MPAYSLTGSILRAKRENTQNQQDGQNPIRCSCDILSGSVKYGNNIVGKIDGLGTDQCWEAAPERGGPTKGQKGAIEQP
jgi:hypothetical protein